LKENDCVWDVRACSAAVAEGHFEVLKWMRENGIPLDDVCSVAAEGGHLEILKWLKTETGCQFDEFVSSCAII